MLYANDLPALNACTFVNVLYGNKVFFLGRRMGGYNIVERNISFG